LIYKFLYPVKRYINIGAIFTMALTKADIINTVQADEGLTKQQSTDIIETLIEIIKNTLQSGEDVLISGSASFVSVIRMREKAGIPLLVMI